MTTLSHLSPDVLEVVRDVARQEDSFLLRVQSVPLRDFTDGRVTPLRSTGTYLSSAERHLLDVCRDELAYALEYALYAALLVTPSGRSVSTRAANERKRDAQRVLDSFKQCQPVVDRLRPSRGVITLLSGAVDDVTAAGWRAIAKQALAIRIRNSVLSNVALGLSFEGRRDETHALGVRIEETSGFRTPELSTVRGLERFQSNAHPQAAVHYLQAWRMAPRDEYAACAALNYWVADVALPGDLAAWIRTLSDSQMTSAASWLRAVLSDPVSSAASRAVGAVLSARGRLPSSHESSPLICELTKQ